MRATILILFPRTSVLLEIGRWATWDLASPEWPFLCSMVMLVEEQTGPSLWVGGDGLGHFRDGVRVCFADFSQGFHTYQCSRFSDAENKFQMRQMALGRILNGSRNHGIQHNVRCLWASRDLQEEWDSQLCFTISPFFIVFLLLKPHGPQSEVSYKHPQSPWQLFQVFRILMGCHRTPRKIFAQLEKNVAVDGKFLNTSWAYMWWAGRAQPLNASEFWDSGAAGWSCKAQHDACMPWDVLTN